MAHERALALEPEPGLGRGGGRSGSGDGDRCSAGPDASCSCGNRGSRGNAGRGLWGGARGGGANGDAAPGGRGPGRRGAWGPAPDSDLWREEQKGPRGPPGARVRPEQWACPKEPRRGSGGFGSLAGNQAALGEEWGRRGQRRRSGACTGPPGAEQRSAAHGPGRGGRVRRAAGGGAARFAAAARGLVAQNPCERCGDRPTSLPGCPSPPAALAPARQPAPHAAEAPGPGPPPMRRACWDATTRLQRGLGALVLGADRRVSPRGPFAESVARRSEMTVACEC